MAVRAFDTGSADCTDPVDSFRVHANEFNPAFDPGEDLDAFVNSRWRERTTIPSGYACWDCFTALHESSLRQQRAIAETCAKLEHAPTDEQRIVGNFWTAAMRDTAVDPNNPTSALYRQLQRIDAIDGSEPLAAYLRDIHAEGRDLLFTLDAQPDFDDPAWSITYVFPAGLGLPDRELYLSCANAAAMCRRSYLTHIAAMLELSGCEPVDASDMAERVMQLETRLARVSLPRRALARDIGRRYNPVSVTEADRCDATFCWRRFFGSLRLYPERFSLAVPEFHAEFSSMLHELPVQTWQAYLRYHLFDDAAAMLGGEPAQAHARFHWQQLRGADAPPPRWRQALSSLNANIGEAMGRLYADIACPPQTRSTLEAMIDQLRTSFADRIAALGWMSASTKCAALNKLGRMRFKIGNPTRRCDWSGLVIGRRSWYDNVCCARLFERRRLAARVDRPTDLEHWSMTPQTVNARYDPQRNEIVVPAALLRPPLFDANADIAVNFGAIGAILAHEMTHGFDDQGSRFGPSGRFENWRTERDRQQFEARAGRLATYVTELTANTPDPVDGLLTLGENIADMGGLAIASDALQYSLAASGDVDTRIGGHTRAQWFFFAWAALWRQRVTSVERDLRRRVDVHAPGPLRANLAARHLRAYETAFGQPNRGLELGPW